MKRNKVFVAITGGIGSGKSTVGAIVRSLGYPVFSADAIARGIYDIPEIRDRVAELFPQSVIDGKVNRKKLAEIVFSDGEKLAQLDAVTHPAIMRQLLSSMEDCAGKIAFAEVPLLFESGSEGCFDRVIVVMRERSSRIASVMERDGLTEAEVAARIKNQFDYERNLNTGHTVLYNNGDIASLKDGVVCIVNEILCSIHS